MWGFLPNNSISPFLSNSPFNGQKAFRFKKPDGVRDGVDVTVRHYADLFLTEVAYTVMGGVGINYVPNSLSFFTQAPSPVRPGVLVMENLEKQFVNILLR